MAHRIFSVLLWLAILLTGSHAHALERITSFDSKVEIQANGDLLVTETISVDAAQNKIRRGIYRDFPTVRGETARGKLRVGFEVLEILRDGAPEKWHTENIPDGKRVYIGQADVMLQTGAHVFTLRYRTDGQVGFFDDHDELYWNVTGNFWAFPILRAQGTIVLPPGAQVKETAAYGGTIGATQNPAEIKKTNTEATFTMTRPLAPGEGLTTVVTWDKGFVAAPSAADSLLQTRGFAALAVGLIVLGGYYLNAWQKYGRDPARGTIVAEYDPPHGISPAACRYILEMDWDDKAFTSAVMNMAARGFLRIERLSDGTFILMLTGKSENDTRLSVGERMVARNLFDGTWKSLPLRSDHHQQIQRAVGSLRKSLEQEHDHIHFLLNKSQLQVGAGITIATGVAAILLDIDIWIDMGVGLLAGFIVFLLYSLTRRTSKTVREAKAFMKVVAIAFLTLLMMGIIPMVTLVYGLMAASEHFQGAAILPAAVTAAIVVVNLIFFEIMKAPTAQGRRLMDHLEGFKHYLTVAEKDRLNFHNPPELTPTRFEAYLPYAVALDVENAWGEQFHDTMERLTRERGTTWDRDTYSPSWFSGQHKGWFGTESSWNSISRAFNQSVATASTAPSQSSGMKPGRGGGFSGGGGGGGGGGGW